VLRRDRAAATGSAPAPRALLRHLAVVVAHRTAHVIVRSFGHFVLLSLKTEGLRNGRRKSSRAGWAHAAGAAARLLGRSSLDPGDDPGPLRVRGLRVGPGRVRDGELRGHGRAGAAGLVGGRDAAADGGRVLLHDRILREVVHRVDRGAVALDAELLEEALGVVPPRVAGGAAARPRGAAARPRGAAARPRGALAARGAGA